MGSSYRLHRHEADGAPAIGIEARKGRDTAPPGLGAKHESPGPKGIAPPRKGIGEAVQGSRPELPVRTDADELQRIGPAAVRVPLHAPEVAPELRRALDRPTAPASLPRQCSVVPVELGDHLGWRAELDDLATLRRLDRLHGGRVRHQRPEVRPASGGRRFEHDARRVIDRQALRSKVLPRRLVSDVPFHIHAHRDLHLRDREATLMPRGRRPAGKPVT